MKLIVLGATGGTGIEIVRQAVARRQREDFFVELSSAAQQVGAIESKET
jgi:uncharacterized protein YbjT (DUF2867 family)